MARERREKSELLRKKMRDRKEAERMMGKVNEREDVTVVVKTKGRIGALGLKRTAPRCVLRGRDQTE